MIDVGVCGGIGGWWKVVYGMMGCEKRLDVGVFCCVYIRKVWL